MSPYPPRYNGGVERVAFLSNWLVLAQQRKAVKMADGREAEFVLAQDFTVSYWIGRELGTITCPAGMLTDLPSIPKAVRSIIDKTGPQLWPAIVHDYLYVAWQDIPNYQPKEADKKFADDIFLAGLERVGVGWLKRQTMYRAVHHFGDRAFFGRDDPRYMAGLTLSV